MTLSNTDELSRAIIVWSGWDDTAWPVRDESRLLAEFGRERAEEMTLRIREIEDEFYASDAHLVATDLEDMANRAVADFRQRRTDLSDAAVEALAWCYTYDYK